jgi:predicted ferric reductase
MYDLTYMFLHQFLLKLGKALKKLTELDQIIRWWNDKTNSSNKYIYTFYIYIFNILKLVIALSGDDVDSLY